MTFHLGTANWERVRLGDVVLNLNESIKNPEYSGIERYIGLEHLVPGDLRVSSYGQTLEGTTFTKHVMPGQTLFGKRRAYQRKIACADFEAVCSGDILVLDAKSNYLLPEFLPFILMGENFYARALETSAGSLSPRTRWSDLAKFEFLIPPVTEQAKIASLFWAVESHRESVASQLASLLSAEESVVAAFLDESSEYVPLSALCEVNPKGTIPKSDQPFKYIDIGSVNYGHPISIGDLESFLISEAPSRAKRVVAEGDILYSTVRPLLRNVGVVPQIDGPSVASTGFTVLRANGEVINSKSIFGIVNSGIFAKKMQDLSKGTSYPSVSAENVGGFQVPSPINSDWSGFDGLMSEFYESKKTLNEESESLKTLRTSLLSVFIDGNLEDV